MSDYPPAGYGLLFDAVLRVAGHEDSGALLYRVDLIDRYHDGPRVPSLLGSSPVFSELTEAMKWATRAVKAFQSAGQF